MSDPRKPRVLVVCTGNRARSQMAEGWLRSLLGERAEVFSAGTKPKGLHPLAVRVMAERGIDIAHHRSKHVDEFASQPFDWVITVCDSAREACPTFPGAGRMVHRAFRDPDQAGLCEAELLELFREVRDQIEAWAGMFVWEEMVERS